MASEEIYVCVCVCVIVVLDWAMLLARFHLVSCVVVCHVVGITYQHIRKSVLQELLGSISGLHVLLYNSNSSYMH